MEEFKDNTGRLWRLSINVRRIKEIRDELKIDLLDFKIDENDKESIPELFEQLSDAVALVDTLWILCRVQAKEREVTDEQFGALLTGDAIEEASDKFLEELANFFPKSRGDHLRTMFGMVKQIEVKMLEGVGEKLNSPKLEESIESAVAGILSGNASG